MNQSINNELNKSTDVKFIQNDSVIKKLFQSMIRSSTPYISESIKRSNEIKENRKKWGAEKMT